MIRSCIGALMEIAEKDENVLYLTADSGEGGLDMMFRRNFSDRSLEFGIAEGNLVAAAAGLAAGGKIPFIYTAAPFLVYRAYEFIRDDVCIGNLPVKMIASGSGLSVSALGPTHHTTEDMAALWAMPHLTILSPATPLQAYACMEYAYETDGPVYIRVGMNGEKEFFTEDYRLEQSGMDQLREGSDMALFTTGGMAAEVMEAAEILSERGIEAAVYAIWRIKPLQAESLCEVISHAPLIAIVEEHNINGGLGSILSDVMIQNGCAKRLIKIGLCDRFSVGYRNTAKGLREENELDGISVAKRIILAMEK